jgi:tetratricopeptide (TPR) repeat protein
MAHSLLAELEIRQGHPDQALDRLQPFVDRVYSFGSPHDYRPVLAWAYLESGRIDRAEEVVGEAVRLAATTHSLLDLVPWLRMQGMVLARQQRWEEAERVFAEAVSVPRSLPYPYAEACALYECGAMYSTKGEPDQAHERLEEALAIFQRLGARKDVERTDQALEMFGP